MFDFESQIGLARTWGKTALDCFAAMASAPLEMTAAAARAWSPEPAGSSRSRSIERRDALRYTPPASGRSWYRPEFESPIQLSFFGVAMPVPQAWLPTAWPVPASMSPWGLPALMPWAPLMALMRTPFPPFRTAFPSPWGWQWPQPDAWPSPTPAAPTFAAYRSDSGHAVAQITFPNDVVATVAVPTPATVLDCFAWMQPRR